MSLKQFLAVGKSFEDVPEGDSPFEMRPEVRLPRFEHEPRFTTRTPIPVQTDWLAETQHRPAEPKGTPGKKNPKRARPERSWLQILSFGLLGRPKKSTGEMVQEEMLLDNVRVIRNDLADSDLEVVVKKGKKFALRATKAEAPAQTKPEPETVEASPVNRITTPAAEAAAPKRQKRYEWSELTVRLFEIGQH